ncbi:MAG: hypothetical protein IKO82_05760 [Prevotella sp.]|nr:hypothetical protein [Prevotella sp.]
MKKEYIEPSDKAVEIKMNQILAGSEVVNDTDQITEQADIASFDAEFEDDF